MTRNLENGEPQNAPRPQENADEKARENRAQDETRRLAAGDWLRAVMGFSAPFGHDGMPTVWG